MLVSTESGSSTSKRVPIPAVVMRPIPPDQSVYQRFPSDPTVMPKGVAAVVPLGAVNSDTMPSVVLLPLLPTGIPVNQRLPSGPLVMIEGVVNFDGSAYSVTAPEGVIFPTFPPMFSVNQRFPSGPDVMAE